MSIMPASLLRWPLPQAASGAALNLTHLLQPASWSRFILTVNLRPDSKWSYRQAIWMGGKPSLRFSLSHGWAQYRCSYFTWKSFIQNMLDWEEWNLITDLAGKVVAFGPGKSCFTFSGMVFVHHLWETEPFVTGFASGWLRDNLAVTLDVNSWRVEP